jgi:biopolymer transport protein ExbD
MLRLTSLIDVMVVLVFFLLKSFVIGGEVMTPTPGISLPNSTSEAQPEESLVVTVFPNRLLVGDESIPYDSPAAGDLILPRLAKRLEAVNNQVDDLARRRGEMQELSRKATIQGDRAIEFRQLERVMFTLNQAGYDQISLAVLQAS